MDAAYLRRVAVIRRFRFGDDNEAEVLAAQNAHYEIHWRGREHTFVQPASKLLTRTHMNEARDKLRQSQKEARKGNVKVENATGKGKGKAKEIVNSHIRFSESAAGDSDSSELSDSYFEPDDEEDEEDEDEYEDKKDGDYKSKDVQMLDEPAAPRQTRLRTNGLTSQKEVPPTYYIFESEHRAQSALEHLKGQFSLPGHIHRNLKVKPNGKYYLRKQQKVGNVILAFGKHRDKHLNAVPQQYKEVTLRDIPELFVVRVPPEEDPEEEEEDELDDLDTPQSETQANGLQNEPTYFLFQSEKRAEKVSDQQGGLIDVLTSGKKFAEWEQQRPRKVVVQFGAHKYKNLKDVPESWKRANIYTLEPKLFFVRMPTGKNAQAYCDGDDGGNGLQTPQSEATELRPKDRIPTYCLYLQRKQAEKALKSFGASLDVLSSGTEFLSWQEQTPGSIIIKFGDLYKGKYLNQVPQAYRKMNIYNCKKDIFIVRVRPGANHKEPTDDNNQKLPTQTSRPSNPPAFPHKSEMKTHKPIPNAPTYYVYNTITQAEGLSNKRQKTAPPTQPRIHFREWERLTPGPKNVVISFGQYKGLHVEDLPADYKTLWLDPPTKKHFIVLQEKKENFKAAKPHTLQRAERKAKYRNGAKK